MKKGYIIIDLRNEKTIQKTIEMFGTMGTQAYSGNERIEWCEETKRYDVSDNCWVLSFEDDNISYQDEEIGGITIYSDWNSYDKKWEKELTGIENVVCELSAIAQKTMQEIMDITILGADDNE